MNNLKLKLVFKDDGKTIVRAIADEDLSYKFAYTLEIPDTVERILTNAFKYILIDEVIIPENVKCIMDSAFEDCQIGRIVIKSSNLYVGQKVFHDCSGLRPGEGIDVDLSAWDTSVIPYKMFLKSKLGNIIFPENIISIGSAAFKNCRITSHITIPNSVYYIGDHAFYGVWAAGITLPNNLKEINPHVFERMRFIGDEEATITIPDSVEMIYESAFYKCKAGEVYFGNKLKEIHSSAFEKCKQLKNVFNLPKSLTVIAERAFYGSGIEYIDLSETSIDTIEDSSFMKTKHLNSMKMPKNLTKIDLYAFARSGIKCLDIPYSVTYIAGSAFEGANLAISESARKLIFKATTSDGVAINGGKYVQYTPRKWTKYIRPIMCKQGYHFCRNITDIFTYYSGYIGDDPNPNVHHGVAIWTVDIKHEMKYPDISKLDKKREYYAQKRYDSSSRFMYDYYDQKLNDIRRKIFERHDSKSVCGSIRLNRKLTHHEIIDILNGKEINIE